MYLGMLVRVDLIIAAAAITAIAIVVIAAVHKWRQRARPDTFLGAIQYNPCFIDSLGTGRITCKGYTSGLMPSIETGEDGGWLCPGLLGVPP